MAVPYACECGRCPLCRANRQTRFSVKAARDRKKSKPKRQFRDVAKPCSLRMRVWRARRIDQRKTDAIREVYLMDLHWPGIPLASMESIRSRETAEYKAQLARLKARLTDDQLRNEMARMVYLLRKDASMADLARLY